MTNVDLLPPCRYAFNRQTVLQTVAYANGVILLMFWYQRSVPSERPSTENSKILLIFYDLGRMRCSCVVAAMSSVGPRWRRRRRRGWWRHRRLRPPPHVDFPSRAQTGTSSTWRPGSAELLRFLKIAGFGFFSIFLGSFRNVKQKLQNTFCQNMKKRYGPLQLSHFSTNDGGEVHGSWSVNVRKNFANWNIFALPRIECHG